MHAGGNWQAVEGVLSKDMVGEYLQTRPDLIVKTQHYKNVVGSLPSQQQGM